MCAAALVLPARLGLDTSGRTGIPHSQEVARGGVVGHPEDADVPGHEERVGSEQVGELRFTPVAIPFQTLAVVRDFWVA